MFSLERKWGKSLSSNVKEKNPNRVAAGKLCGKASRHKGAVGELEAAKLWQRWFPDCKRILGQARMGGSEAPDIGSAEMNKDYYVEVKRYKRITDGMVGRFFDKMFDDWWQWSLNANIEAWPMPVLVFRGDNEKWSVAISKEQCDRELWDAVIDSAEEIRHELIVMDWSDFASELDKIHGGSDE